MFESFESVEETVNLLQQHHYITEVGLATCLFLSQKLGKAVFLEGEPGVGKTEIAKVLSEIFDTPLIRPLAVLRRAGHQPRGL
jgi:MoxR-like ATPase